ncbi:MAG: riboflavin biosynthesis protein RibF [Thermoguttaceae bacterium]
MLVIRDESVQTPKLSDLQGAVLSIGKFDGVHLGHARVLKRVKELAEKLNCPAIAITFDPPPAAVLHPQFAATSLCTFERKVELLEKFQLDALLVLKTNVDLLALTAEEFFDQIIVGKINASGVIESSSFTFGKDRLGNADVLLTLGNSAGISVEIVEPVYEHGCMISSSRIRSLLREGKTDIAAMMLTEPYRITGTVVEGEKRGRTLGFPTINLADIETLIPKSGVYACVCHFDGKSFPAPTSIGGNLTFGEDWLKIESFLVGFNGDLYGKQVHLDFLAPIREIVKFESVSELIQQMQIDVEKTVQIVEKHAASDTNTKYV